VDGDVSAEVISTDFKGIIKEGKALAAIAPNIVVKVPMIKEGVKALRWFTDNDIRTMILIGMELILFVNLRNYTLYRVLKQRY